MFFFPKVRADPAAPDSYFPSDLMRILPRMNSSELEAAKFSVTESPTFRWPVALRPGLLRPLQRRVIISHQKLIETNYMFSRPTLLKRKNNAAKRK